jgi:prepilin-type N-terminal cleavage/methylation domain-containing protein
LEQQRKTDRRNGFTLIEMMIVISLILILISIAVPIYNRSILRAKEAVLRQNLFTLRQVISQYTMDNRKPRSRSMTLRSRTKADTKGGGAIPLNSSSHVAGETEPGRTCATIYKKKPGR